MSGRLLREIEPWAVVDAGTHTVTWDGRDDRGVSVSSGVYYVRLETPTSVASEKMVILK